MWFSSIDDTVQYSREVLSKGRSGDYPPFAPLADPQVVLAINKQMSAEGRLAVGLPHIFANYKLPGIGLGNRVAMGDYSFGYMLDFVRENVHAIGAFNLDNPAAQRLKFKDPQVRHRFLEIAKEYWEKTGRSGPFAMTPNLMCLALSDY
ncbi:MAG TPA: hypothetical protein PLO51_03595, partial [Candidatus Micrarchaeota archaeon]|nr:hypothetical protein [Candidatus Micrarchaeota archaeon]